MDDLPTRFTNAELQRIADQAMIYMCACPAQVAHEILALRELHGYQRACFSKGSALEAVHQRIAESTQQAHAEMERCLDAILDMEGWDRATMTMPAGLRELRDRQLEKGLD